MDKVPVKSFDLIATLTEEGIEEITLDYLRVRLPIEQQKSLLRLECERKIKQLED